MSIVMQINPFDYFSDQKGEALDEGYVWIGQANKDPRQFPIPVYFDAALTIPAAVPLRTNAGYIVRGNSPTLLYIGGNYSILVQDKKGRQVYYVPDFLMIGNSSAVSSGDLTNATDPAKGAGMIGFTNTGTGAIASTAYRKLTEWHSLFDFMTNAERNDIQSGTSALNHTAALSRAIQSGYGIELPDGQINATAIDVLDGTRLRGKGHSAGRPGVPRLGGTLIRALPSTEIHFMRIPTGRVRGVELVNFSMIGDLTSNPGQNGLSMDGIVNGGDGGLWDFNFDSLYISGFGADNFRLAGGFENTQSPMQFGRVSHVVVERPTSTSRSLVLTGQCEHIAFEECRFDGVFNLGAAGDGSYMGRVDTLHDIRPNNITFVNASFQRANIALTIDRCENVTMITPWFETVTVGIEQKSASTGLEIINPRFANVQIGLRSGSGCRSSMRSPVVAGTITNLFVGSFHAGASIDSTSKGGISTQNVNYDVAVGAGTTALSVQAHKFSPHTFAAGITIDTINGFHMPGETVTIFASTNNVSFVNGGNISLASLGSPFVLQAGRTITFIKTDTNGLAPWRAMCTA